MAEFVAANWIVIGIALMIGIATAYWVWGRRGSTMIDHDAYHESAAETAISDTAHEVGDALASSSAASVGYAAHRDAVVADMAAHPVGDDADPPARPKIAPAVGDPDNLLQIKGIGPKLNTLLNILGVSRFDQIAAWNAADAAEVDQYLEGFKGRIERDNWIDQAKYLSVGNIDGFEAKYGKL